MASTRTLRSTAANPASVSSSAPGCWPSSATTRTATPTPKRGRTTPACHRSPKPPAPNGSCWPASPATAASATRCSCRPSRALEQLPRRPRLLRPAARPRSHPLPSPPHPREPARRHPPRLPTNPHPLRRAPRLAHRTRQTQPCSLTASGRGMSSQGPIRIGGRYWI